MPSTTLPFYTQAALIERYARKPEPSADLNAVEIVIEMLRTHRDLREYFFRCGPAPAWARILWDRGFLATPPEPKKVANGYTLPAWDTQTFLIIVAHEVPDIVLKHLEDIEGHPFYVAHAVEAATRLDIKDFLPAFDTFIQRIRVTGVLDYVFREVEKLLSRLLENEKIDYAFALAKELIAPTDIDLSGTNILKNSTSNLPDWYEEKFIEPLASILARYDIERTLSILEENLLAAIELEAKSGLPSHTWWRSAIEDTDQDSHDQYKDRLLKALRNVLEIWVQRDPLSAEPFVMRYLRSDAPILRRVGMHTLNKFPQFYIQRVHDELLKPQNYDDLEIHHEFFLLLKNGTPYLDADLRNELIRALLDGPSQERLQRKSKDLTQDTEENEYIESFTKYWIRDRLWMIQDSLQDEERAILSNLINELGAPSNPEFLAWHTAFYAISDVSSLSDEDILNRTPEDLVEYLQNWRPPQNQEFGPKQVSLRGMAEHVARLLVSNVSKYGDVLTTISLIHPEYAYALLDTIKAVAPQLSWAIKLTLCENLLVTPDVLEGGDRSAETNWREVKKRLLDLLESGLDESKESEALPFEYLSRVRDMLVRLAGDADPLPSDDRPQQGMFGHNDPSTVAINTVRPRALSTLIRYARYRLMVLGKDIALSPEVNRVEKEVADLYTQKADYTRDPSWAVHSVFGKHLNLIYWLEPEWFEEHLDRIFPEDEGEDTIWFFIAAWSSYVSFNGPIKQMFPLLFRKYRKAIEYLGKGLKLEGHLDAGQGLATHLLLYFLDSDADIYDSTEVSVLLRKFFSHASPEDRGSAAWRLWDISHRRQDRWDQIRSIWKWRVNEASIADHSTDYDRELNWFMKLIEFAPSSENINTLWPLLEASIVHVTRDEPYGISLETLEKFLISQAKPFPLQTIRLYRLVLESLFTNKEFVHLDIQRVSEILLATCKSVTSKQDTLATIDFLARHRHHQFKSIYDTCTSS